MQLGRNHFEDEMNRRIKISMWSTSSTSSMADDDDINK